MTIECIAVLITSHNRRESTLAALRALESQCLPSAVQLTPILVDAGSSDGTREAVSQSHPHVRLIGAASNVYWNQGMRRAFEVAAKLQPDAFLWLNDDTILNEDAIARLLDTVREVAEVEERPLIVVGATCDPATGEHTYGGLVQVSGLRPYKCAHATPREHPYEVDTMCGNCVLVTASAADTVGNLDPVYTHAFGDLDYGFRAHKSGCRIWAAPGFVGTCRRHPPVSRDVSMKERWQYILGPKGLPPREWAIFLIRYGGIIWPFFWIAPYIRLAIEGSKRAMFR